ncbi:MAG: DUF5615 family PIN-like protein [Candidatus Sumerlaeota bacterium]|nr:DUF5615 family PIN-like protein [Candidatus Sumerlaeota bacterium]
MRLYLDQMFHINLSSLLRLEGFDVVHASEIGQERSDDADILKKAIIEDRVLVTLDKHFGDWTMLPLKHHPGVIRLEIEPTTTENARKLLLPLLAGHTQEDFRNYLLIAEEKRIRWIHTGD